MKLFCEVYMYKQIIVYIDVIVYNYSSVDVMWVCGFIKTFLHVIIGSIVHTFL